MSLSGSQVYRADSGEWSDGETPLSSYYRGADIRLEKGMDGGITHITPSSGGGYTKPRVRSYPDGIRVGCTFITNEAIELIYDWHQEYLKNGNSKVHQ